MFSENNRISGRQMYRLMTYDLLGIGTLLVPQMLAKTAGRDGILSIGIGMAAALAYLWILRRLAPPAQESYPEYMERQLGRIGGGIVQTGYLIYLVLLAGYVAYLFADIILRDLLRGESFYLVLSVIMLLVLYGLAGGIEGRARVYEMLFWFLLIPLFLMLFAAADEVCTDYWAPLGMSSLKGVAGGAYGVFLNLSFAFFLLFSGTYVRRQETLFAAGKRAILFVGCLHAVLYLVLEGIFGVPALAGMDYPAVTLMSTVKISGGFLKRTDAFMFGVWFFTLYALLNSCVFYGSSINYGNLFAKCQKGKITCGFSMDLWRWQLLWQRSVFTGAGRSLTGTSGSCGMSVRRFWCLPPSLLHRKNGEGGCLRLR